ncbi:MAG: GIY-YIG nuclease family protein [Chitinophagaceae bacterium]
MSNKSSIVQMNLYWLTTSDGFENWFVFANTQKLAEQFHENGEGYGNNYAKAELVCVIPQNLVDQYNLKEQAEFWPSHDLLRELGAKIESEDNPRIVNFNGKVYKEGNFTEGFFLSDIGRSKGVYVINVQNTNKYKIGRTSNLSLRLKQIKTSSPYNIKLVYFIRTLHYVSLEAHLHKAFKAYRGQGEWFDFDDITLKEFEMNLALLDDAPFNQFKSYNIKALSIHGRQY